MSQMLHKIKRKPYFYDAQIKRYLLQISSAFAGYTVRSGVQRDGNHRVIDVPVVFGDSSRVVAYLNAGGNENTVASLPVMALDLVRLKQNAEMRRSATHTEKIFYTPRADSTVEGTLSSAAAPDSGLQRHMPVPYDMGVRLSIWASNNDQGFQLTEQISTQYNPDVDILLSNSPYDWTFLSYLRFDGDVSLGRGSADIGAGKDDAPYVYSMNFSTMVWLSPPAKVMAPNSVDSIHVRALELNVPVDFDSMTELDTLVITGS